MTKIWPLVWKREYVTVIPKFRNPSNVSGLRNILRTPLASKIYKSYILSWAQLEIKLKSNQYRGVKGCSTSDMLINIYQNIAKDLEDYRAATVLMGINFAQAFNRLSYQSCYVCPIHSSTTQDPLSRQQWGT